MKDSQKGVTGRLEEMNDNNTKMQGQLENLTKVIADLLLHLFNNQNKGKGVMEEESIL